MTLPLMVLAFFAVTAGWAGIPEHFPVLGTWYPGWFNDFVGHTLPEPIHPVMSSSASCLADIHHRLVGRPGTGLVGLPKLPGGQEDPLCGSARLPYGPAEQVLLRRDLRLPVRRPAYWLSETFTFRWMDRGLIDGILHAVSWVPSRIGVPAHATALCWIVNGFGDFVGEGVKVAWTALPLHPDRQPAAVYAGCPGARLQHLVRTTCILCYDRPSPACL
jgi:hypothetical protein